MQHLARALRTAMPRVAARQSLATAPRLARGFAAGATGEAGEGAAAAPGAAAAAGAAAPAGEAAGLDAAASAALRAELTESQKRLRESLEARAYLQADMENVRRIAKNDVDKAKTYAALPIAKGLLLAIDNLQAALAALPPGSNDGGGVLFEGVQSTLKITLKVLGEHGVAQFGASGERFDPNVHEAVAMLPSAAGGPPHNHILSVLKPGFMFKDRVLRPAQVSVHVCGCV